MKEEEILKKTRAKQIDSIEINQPVCDKNSNLKSWYARKFVHFFCRLLIIFKINVKNNFFGNYTIRVKNRFYPDQARKNVRPDLGKNCLQRLSGDDKISH